MKSPNTQAGFTLLELLVAMSLAGLVFSVVSAAFVVSVDVTEDTNTRLTESQAGAFTSAYFTRDVQSASTISTSTPRCGGGSETLVASMQWTDTATTTTKTYSVDYRLEAGRLTRFLCGSATSSDLVASNLTAASMTCTPASCVDSARLDLDGLGDGAFSIVAERRLP
ncbi:MAG: prepilin-type N-terminal cleavage/methylation domain-containing protein [Mycobacteriales bacterium]|nr:prepilin-type N-terminal cleavage/methylation domain-containing protein [Mycobacteriales bacterium]